MPTRKVSVGALAGAVVALVLGVVYIIDPVLADRINPAVAVAASTVIGTLLSYIIPEKDQAQMP
jgi:hypothetical protein